MSALTAKLGAGFRVVAAAVAEPKLVRTALKEANMASIVRTFVKSDDARIGEMIRHLRLRSHADSIDGLLAMCGDFVASIEPADPEHWMLVLRSGQRFLIRKSAPRADVLALRETFSEGKYGGFAVKTGNIVIDVGANIGDTAVFFGLQGATVHAFEPSAELYQLAERNAALNGVRARFTSAGVGDSNCTMPISVGSGGADLFSTVYGKWMSEQPQRHRPGPPVSVLAFSDVIRSFERVDLLKMNCEGCEFPALLSLLPADLRTIRCIVLEYHRTPGLLQELLSANGFAVCLRPASTTPVKGLLVARR